MREQSSESIEYSLSVDKNYESNSISSYLSIDNDDSYTENSSNQKFDLNRIANKNLNNIYNEQLKHKFGSRMFFICLFIYF